MLAAITDRISSMSRELKIFVLVSFVLSVSYSLVDSTFNNYLNERFQLTGFQRSFLELPREFPGVMVIFVSALVWFLCSRRLGAWSLILAAFGTFMMGFFSPSYGILIIWLFIYSLGSHLYMPVASTIGMELASAGKTAQRLGQLNSVRNLATIAGSFLVFIGFGYLDFTFSHTFALGTIGLLIAAGLMFLMKPQPSSKPRLYLKLRKEYSLFYILAILFGSRKQLFITFAPWVIVTVFNQPTQTLATLLTIGGVIGIVFQPLLGWAIDKFGERIVLVAEAVITVFLCLGYGFGREIFPEHTAFLIVCGLYVLDQMLMSVGMARSTYIKKIALQPEDVQPALTASVTLDHIFTIVIALIGGVIWNNFGFQYVFLMGSFIALLNIFAASQVRIPSQA